MKTWNSIYNRIARIVGEEDEGLLFRGHGDVSWSLMPGLGRHGWDITEVQTVEENTYFGFVTSAGNLLRGVDEAWDVLFAMQHHGVPTRLLDWTTRFGVALHFALASGTGDAVVWVLDPFALNGRTRGHDWLIRATELGGTYFNHFIVRDAPFMSPVVALMSSRDQPRLSSQYAAFTLHRDLNKPLEELYPTVLRKIVIPAALRNDAALFLKVAGISEFSVFPDLDGLARELRWQHFPR